jgi:hypothetical protein
MSQIRVVEWRVSVYHHSGFLRQVIKVLAATPESARNKAGKEMYRQGHLPHMYTYVPQRLSNIAAEYLRQSRGE